MTGEAFWRPPGGGAVDVKEGGTLVGSRSAINLIAGSGVTLSVTDDAANDEVDVEIAASGGGGGGSLTYLDEVELASDASSISLSSIPGTYRDLIVVGELRSDRPSSTADGTNLRVGNGTVDSGSNYRYHRTELRENGSAARVGGEGQTSIQGVVVPAAGGDSGAFASLEITFIRYADTSRHCRIQGQWSTLSDAAEMRNGQVGAAWQNTADAIDIITFTPVNGPNFIAGSYLTLYGRG